MTTIKEYSGVVALVILAIMGLSGFVHGNSFGSASACTDGYTCFTNLEVQGNYLVDGTSGFTGATTFAGGVFASSTLQTTATTTDYGNVVVRTSDTATSSVAAGCFGFNATSTASPGHLIPTVSQISTSTVDGAAATVYPLVFRFGKCPGT